MMNNFISMIFLIYLCQIASHFSSHSLLIQPFAKANSFLLLSTISLWNNLPEMLYILLIVKRHIVYLIIPLFFVLKSQCFCDYTCTHITILLLCCVFASVFCYTFHFAV